MNVKHLRSRWLGSNHILSMISPFGLTESGRQDFREFEFSDIAGGSKKTVKSKVFRNMDLSGANLASTVFEGCVFEDCIFENCNLQDIVVRYGEFVRCFFSKADFRGSGIGVGLTKFDTCQLSRSKMSGISFHYNHFSNMRFEGKDWKNVDFGVAGFMSCIFKGKFSGCQFEANFQNEDERNQFGFPIHTGFHDVDLSDAEFYLVRFRPDWVFENTTLPKGGKFATVEQILALRKKYPKNSSQFFVVNEFIEVFVKGNPEKDRFFVSVHDLKDFGFSQAGQKVFDRI
jgi:hypothetical protein